MQRIPVLRIGPVLLVSVQTELDDRVASDLQEEVLKRIQETGATALLIDITALGIVDSFVGRILSETARMARIMNTKVVLVGMQPAVAITLLEMGLELPDISAAINVDFGLEALGYRLAHAEEAAKPGEVGGEVPGPGDIGNGNG